MKLFGSYTSPYVRHIRIALLQSHLPFELILTDHAQSAELSPTARVPFLEDGGLRLLDSTSILMHVRQQAGQAFLGAPVDYDLYCLANTALDSAIALLLSKNLDGADESTSGYLTRQRRRVEACLDELESRALYVATSALMSGPAPSAATSAMSGAFSRTLPLSDAAIRVACLLDWGLFRRIFSLTARPHLAEFLDFARSWTVFADTAPPAA